MARANTITQLSLDRFFELISLHPLHGNQVTVSSVPGCGTTILQYSWQNVDRVGREEIAQAIFDAERILSSYLRFDIGPRYHTDEQVVLGQNGRVTTDWKYVIEPGVRAVSLVEANSAVVYSDLDGDGYKETAATVVPQITSGEYQVRYPGMDESWAIRPIFVSTGGGNATITMRRHQLVVADLLEGFDAHEVDGLEDSNFLSEVDVYRVFTDTSQQVKFVSSCSSDCSSCSTEYSPGCLVVLDKRLGYCQAVPTSKLCLRVNRALISYKAGLEEDLQLWERAIAYLALANLDHAICTCSSLERYTKYWREDLAMRVSTSAKSESRILSRNDLVNPFGTTRAGLYAWRLVQRYYVP